MFCFLQWRKFREKCHIWLLLPTEEKIQGKMPFQSLASTLKKIQGKIPFQSLASYAEENSGINANSEFSFQLRRKFRGKCHIWLLLSTEEKNQGNCHFGILPKIQFNFVLVLSGVLYLIRGVLPKIWDGGRTLWSSESTVLPYESWFVRNECDFYIYLEFSMGVIYGGVNLRVLSV